jgi:hypothetical protein
MKGLDLAEECYRQHGVQMISNRFSAYANRIAAGFVGPGSECFGFDDEISRDHDWGPGFCMWLTAEDHTKIGSTLQEEYEKLPDTFMGFGPRLVSPGEEGRTGVDTTTSFYKTYTGLDHPPQNIGEWLHIPEQSLAVCTNGKVFHDPLGQFTRWRKQLKGYYPEDVRLKKIASRCVTIAQAGQYNFERSLNRNELFAVRYSEMKFCSDVMSLLFLLNRRYTPFYKWMHRAGRDLPVLGQQVHALILELMEEQDSGVKKETIERICAQLIDELQQEGLTDSQSDFLLDHAYSVHSRIQDKALKERFSIIN